MHTQLQAKPCFGQTIQENSAPDMFSASMARGIISEVVYFEDQPMVGHILLPLLRQLGMQSRWLLWLTSSRKLSRPWLRQSGLPLEKMVQVRRPTAFDTVAAMEKALLTGNYSVILGWFPEELTVNDKRRLRDAAQRGGGSYGFIMYPQNESSRSSGQFSALKIHSNRYH
ncbi:SOS-induced cell division inhibitor SulA [Acerihabitans sp. KWT182]|uniref:Cell division inhibitor SulA n=1 Tax=Acerihabitans sp. KWT182 TaxID=3157919 RepID=A0AAU7QD92_9GAMM